MKLKAPSRGEKLIMSITAGMLVVGFALAMLTQMYQVAMMRAQVPHLFEDRWGPVYQMPRTRVLPTKKSYGPAFYCDTHDCSKRWA